MNKKIIYKNSCYELTKLTSEFIGFDGDLVLDSMPLDDIKRLLKRCIDMESRTVGMLSEEFINNCNLANSELGIITRNEHNELFSAVNMYCNINFIMKIKDFDEKAIYKGFLILERLNKHYENIKNSFDNEFSNKTFVR